jgi:hypothetical protein
MAIKKSDRSAGIKKKSAAGSIDEVYLKPFLALAKQMAGLYKDTLRAYTPLVEGILHSQSRDIKHIEQTLDGLLGFCDDEQALTLYRRLCRHYHEIDAEAAVFYVKAYRDMWDPKQLNFGPGKVDRKVVS